MISLLTGDEIARGRRNEYLIHCYMEVSKSREGRMRKTLLCKSAKPSLPGSPCHCRCYGVAPHGVAAAAIAAVLLPSVRHTGAARSNFNTKDGRMGMVAFTPGGNFRSLSQKINV